MSGGSMKRPVRKIARPPALHSSRNALARRVDLPAPAFPSTTSPVGPVETTIGFWRKPRNARSTSSSGGGTNSSSSKLDFLTPLVGIFIILLPFSSYSSTLRMLLKWSRDSSQVLARTLESGIESQQVVIFSDR